MFGYFVFILTLFVISPASAETLTLISGQQVTGNIIEKNDMHLIIDVTGSPVTYFLGEVAAIDGQPVVIGQEAIVEEVAEAKTTEEKSIKVDDEASLVKFMTDRHAESKAPAPEPKAPVAIKPCPTCPKPPVVTIAPDGGVIVVTAQKISKYDKDLKLVKEVPAP